MDFKQAQEYHAERKEIEAWLATWLMENGFGKFTYALPIDLMPGILHNFLKAAHSPGLRINHAAFPEK